MPNGDVKSDMIKVILRDEISQSECSPLVTRVLKSPSGKESSFRIMRDIAWAVRIMPNRPKSRRNISMANGFLLQETMQILPSWNPWRILHAMFGTRKHEGSQNEISSLGPISNKLFSKSHKAHTAEIFEWFMPNLRIPVTILLGSLRSHRIRYYPQAYPRFSGNFCWCAGKTRYSDRAHILWFNGG